MRIRLLTGWNGNTKGAELDLDEGQASLLIERAKAERIVEAKAERSAENKAITKPPANKKRR